MIVWPIFIINFNNNLKFDCAAPGQWGEGGRQSLLILDVIQGPLNTDSVFRRASWRRLSECSARMTRAASRQRNSSLSSHTYRARWALEKRKKGFQLWSDSLVLYIKVWADARKWVSPPWWMCFRVMKVRKCIQGQ